MKSTTRDACKLMHDGALALSRVEANGIRIDEVRLDRTIDKVGRRIDKLTERLKESSEWKLWEKKYGRKMKLSARQQLVWVLQEMGHEWEARTEKGNLKADVKVLESLDIPFVKDYLKIEDLKNFQATFLRGIRREVVDELLHPFFDLHKVRTYRSSSSRPNFQNIPIRDPVIGKLIRSCFIPRKDHVLVEIDFSGLEVRIAACYHQDPVMVEYIEMGYDLHQEMAAQCFSVEQRQVSKDMRFYVKNQFVFPEFYGSYSVQCAENLWKVIDGLELVSGVKLWVYLDGVGLGDYDSFEDHIKEIERKLWERFKVYARWKLDWYEQYKWRGWFDLLTGFRESGVYKRNDAINHSVQGSAFHCLLWCLIELVKWMEKRKMRSKVVGQIHDSIIADVHRSELEEFVEKARQLMTRDIRKAWEWIIVPLDVDVEISETNWYEKKAI